MSMPQAVFSIAPVEPSRCPDQGKAEPPTALTKEHLDKEVRANDKTPCDRCISALPDLQSLHEPKAVSRCQGFEKQLVNGHQCSLPGSALLTAAAWCGCRQRLSPSQWHQTRPPRSIHAAV